MRLMLPVILLLAACGEPAQTHQKPRPNRVLLAVSLVNPKAECYPVATPMDNTPAPDTAYCAIDSDVVFCKAGASEPIRCEKVGQRKAEKPVNDVPPPVKAGDAK